MRCGRALAAGLSVLALVGWLGAARAQEQEVTITGREIVERLTRLEEGQKALQQRLEQVDRRLEQGLAAVNERLGREVAVLTQRLEQMDRRLEQGLAAVNERIGREVAAVNRRLEQGLAAVNQRMDAVEKRIGELQEFLLWGFGLTFGGMFALIGFVLWDRRTALAPAVRRLEELQDREQRLEAALREYARGTLPLDEALRKHGLL
ncbi:MAG: hypothetical protein KatS3mg131_2279 [Candidatus Tectimicrobiota bacterium]|nr:MAG: hypothetical protein KatS3mg131_2279 [Candidatus Tectomicrobia bacterium]